LSIKVVGIILVSALIVIPAAAAYQWTEDFRRMMILAVLIGNISAVSGLFLSYRLDTASGATMVLTATAVFFLSVVLSPRQRGLSFRLRGVRGRAIITEEAPDPHADVPPPAEEGRSS
jgi:ABC-type Mn2+/Zn2+ transport system permease subunit